MHLSLILAVVIPVAVQATALPDDHSDVHGLILERQAPGTPQYNCHADCGAASAGRRDPAHCSNSTWTAAYDDCLECALDFNIWTIYGGGVSSAASSCGLSPTPSPSGDTPTAPPVTTSSSSSSSSPASLPTTTTAYPYQRCFES
ncbi:hypothetical protein B0T26DRAFT_672414 [Lasiosphaeria miniovina]|uniref:Uncharacterized protein n=1 Tax=Lasiosphaeria miniovina TaxID=1954250 RepID=A0AA40E7D7_9PEZI|nr:uncharacterized protein B0T26DRAFT_672414 [Lasiosphaeria miniovina]KAK0727792.1 hypothetical protein B0T26DRAFT_672414 [Lasiosphaeria miniovina]